MDNPVLATNVGGIPEMMIDNETGFLIREGEPKQWIEKIDFLINNKEEGIEMGKKGREFVSHIFDWDIIAQKFLESIKLYIKN